LVVNSSQNSSSLSQGLVGWWTFDGKNLISNVADSSGLGNNGYMQGFGATSTAVTQGVSGQGLKFDGRNDYVKTSWTSDTYFSDTTFSVSFWVKSSASGSNGGYCLICKDAISSSGWRIRFNGAATNRLMVEYRGPGDGGIGTNYRVSSVSVVDGKWHHVTVINTTNTTVIGGNDINIYIDGILSQGSLTNNGVYYVSANAIRSGFGGSGYFNGSLDDVRIYSRALSASEIKQLYNAGAGSKVNASQQTDTTTSLKTGLVGHWTFDSKDLKTNVADRSGLGNNGYLTNFGATSTAVTIGKIGQGLKFDGADDYVVSASGVTTYPFTVTAWFKTNGGAKASSDFYSMGNSGTASPYLVVGWDSSKYIFSQMRGDDGSSMATPTTNTTAYNNDKWHFLTLTVTSATARSLIIDNGTPIDNTSSTGASMTFNRQTIGALGRTSFSAYSNASVDDVRVYSRILSAQEIKQLYNAGAGSKVNASQQTDTTTSLKTGLVGHWTFDSKDLKTNVADSSGSGNNGYLTGFGATSTAVTAGKLGQGLKFDGVDDYVETNMSTNYQTGDFSISAWISFNDLSRPSERIVAKDSGSGWALSHNDGANASKKIRFFVRGMTTIVLDSENVFNQSNRWYHVVAVFDHTNQKRYIYVDNALRGSINSDTGTASTDSATIRIAKSNSSTFGGSMDDIRIYSRALSAQEVKQLYNTGR